MFDYYCPKCDETKERFVRKADEEVQCLTCNSKVEKQVTGCAFKVPGAYDGRMKIQDRSKGDKE